MARYIDRDKALSFPLANGKYDHKNANEHFIFGCETYKEWLEQLPTISPDDVRGVVHCCHCRHAEPRDPVGIKTEIFCRLFCAGMRENDYCSYGKLLTNSVPWMEVTSDA